MEFWDHRFQSRDNIPCRIYLPLDFNSHHLNALALFLPLVISFLSSIMSLLLCCSCSNKVQLAHTHIHLRNVCEWFSFCFLFKSYICLAKFQCPDGECEETTQVMCMHDIMRGLDGCSLKSDTFCIATLLFPASPPSLTWPSIEKNYFSLRIFLLKNISWCY